MPRIPLIAGNWKMNTTLAEGRSLVASMLPELDRIAGVEKVVCPPFIALAVAADLARGSTVAIGAQNLYFEQKGAFTGEVSPLMLQGLCDYVIVGHSERRAIFGETDEVVARKVASALGHGLRPILCVGETAHERQSDRAYGVVGAQIQAALRNAAFDAGIVVAYEPVWAIGSGMPATGEIANEMCSFIRKEVASLSSQDQAQQLRILYGGSVTPQSVGEFLGQHDIDGALVGGASLKAEDFVAIVAATGQVARAKGMS